MSPEEHVQAHEARGSRLDVNGLSTFVRDQGAGDVVLLMHGVPVSSYVWRKVMPELVQQGLRAVAYDLPGLGFSERPESFDYTWSGLGRHAVALVNQLRLSRFHLVVHDIGGPIGFELASVMPERVASLTILNTIIEVARFKKPAIMRPFGVKGVGEAYLRSMVDWVFVRFMYLQGVSDKSRCPPDELVGHRRLLLREDGGRAFLQIMRGFETTTEKQARYLGVVQEPNLPKRALWGERDPALNLKRYGSVARRLVGDPNFRTVPAKHFLQESHPEAVAHTVAEVMRPA
ncbi:MAG: alpha/beta fold hydrolase [Myxococcota bacterium]